MAQIIQFRYDIDNIQVMMSDLGLKWTYGSPHQEADMWIFNLDCLVESLYEWCRLSGMSQFALGYTQIELCVTFADFNEATLFKLRWNNVSTR